MKCLAATDSDDGQFSISGDGTLRVAGCVGTRICLPELLSILTLKLAHDALGYFGYKKTYDRIAETYFRPSLSKVVKAYVSGCPQCIQNKTARRLPEGSLLPIDADPLPAAFDTVSFEIIVSLPFSKGFDAVMVVVDKFSKYGIFIPAMSNFTAESAARYFFDNVVRQGWLPTKFITDRDPQWIKGFWRHLAQRLGIDHRLSMAYHAQTDGAREHLNQILEVALRVYPSPMQDDWSDHLPLVELAYNTAKSVTTGFAPIKLIYIQPQNIIARLVSPTKVTTTLSDDTAAFLDVAKNRIVDAQDMIRLAVASQKQYYDARHTPPTQYKVGDLVCLQLDKHPIAAIKVNKLSPQKLPPYKVVKVHSSGRALEVDFPEELKIHRTVSVQYVERVPPDNFNRPTPALPPIAKFSESLFDKRVSRGKTKYQVKFEGYDVTQAKWMDKEDLPNTMVADYERRYIGHRIRTLATELVEAITDDAELYPLPRRFLTVHPKKSQFME